jgi:hypothetical protein
VPMPPSMPRPEATRPSGETLARDSILPFLGSRLGRPSVYGRLGWPRVQVAPSRFSIAERPKDYAKMLLWPPTEPPPSNRRHRLRGPDLERGAIYSLPFPPPRRPQRPCCRTTLGFSGEQPRERSDRGDRPTASPGQRFSNQVRNVERPATRLAHKRTVAKVPILLGA